MIRTRFPHRIKKVAGVENIIAYVIEQRAVENIAARLRYDADLPARTGAELRRVIAGFHAEFLNVLQARLQSKTGGRFAVQITWRSIDD